jgi:hypothetical protein
MDVPEDALQSNEVRLPRIMHVEADLLDCVGNIWSAEGQILKGASKAPEICSILNKNTIFTELWVAIDRSGTWLALGHASTSKDVKHARDRNKPSPWRWTSMPKN